MAGARAAREFGVGAAGHWAECREREKEEARAVTMEAVTTVAQRAVAGVTEVAEVALWAGRGGRAAAW